MIGTAHFFWRAMRAAVWSCRVARFFQPEVSPPSCLVFVPSCVTISVEVPMAYRLPTFNLLCDIFSPSPGVPPNLPGGPPRIGSVPCQLCWGRVVEGPGAAGVWFMHLKLPAGTDIRGQYQNGFFDVVQVPRGSGRTYFVVYVDDVGKGFPNEYRQAILTAQPFQVNNPIPWP